MWRGCAVSWCSSLFDLLDNSHKPLIFDALMAMVDVDLGSLQADSQPKSLAWSEGRRLLGAVLHSSNEPGELSQWFCHDDSTINISICIIIITYLLTCLRTKHQPCSEIRQGSICGPTHQWCLLGIMACSNVYFQCLSTLTRHKDAHEVVHFAAETAEWLTSSGFTSYMLISHVDWPAAAGDVTSDVTASPEWQHYVTYADEFTTLDGRRTCHSVTVANRSIARVTSLVT